MNLIVEFSRGVEGADLGTNPGLRFRSEPFGVEEPVELRRFFKAPGRDRISS